MPNLESLRPARRDRVMDLLAEAGHDVSDWANYEGGLDRAATNPRYCYEWSFVQDNKAVVLNFWYENLKTRAGVVFQNHNFLRWASTAQKTAWRTRALKMNFAVSTAWEEGLPVRVILCDGVMRDAKHPLARASQVRARELDGVSWAVTSYNRMTGNVTVTRHAKPLQGFSPSGRSSYPGELPVGGKYQE